MEAAVKIAVLGTGAVGRALAGALANLGHEVVIGTRDPEQTLSREGQDPMGRPPFGEWRREHPHVALAAFDEAAAAAELVINATNGMASLEVLNSAGKDNLAGKVLVDVANPLDASQGMPPILNPVNTDSLGEQIQRRFPEAKVVKTLNTMNAGLMVNPRRAGGGEHSTFMSGNDDAAKQAVKTLLASLGHSDIIDLGDITTARGAEMLLPVWIRLWGVLGTLDFNFKIVR